jgi:hypothetical protein
MPISILELYLYFASVILFVVVVGGWILWRKWKWYILHLQRDNRNPHQPPHIYLMTTKYKNGIEYGVVYAHYWSLWPVKGMDRVTEKPDLRRVAFGKHLIAVRGRQGQPGDSTLYFIRIEVPSGVDITNYAVDAQDAFMEALGKVPVEDLKDPLKVSEDLKAIFTPAWVEKTLGISTSTIKHEPLLREEKITYQAIESDNVKFWQANQPTWVQFVLPVLMVAIIVAVGIFLYIGWTGEQNYMQVLTGAGNKLIQEMNLNAQYQYQMLKALNVYGIKPPSNYSNLTSGGGSSLIPTSLPST